MMAGICSRTAIRTVGSMSAKSVEPPRKTSIKMRRSSASVVSWSNAVAGKRAKISTNGATAAESVGNAAFP